ncbi:hypothetical protein TNCV_1020461 [Trichonephila clavipes]|nr:hypothetical protein TNCV_1020461 [Trichonephila clavipes]
MKALEGQDAKMRVIVRQFRTASTVSLSTLFNVLYSLFYSTISRCLAEAVSPLPMARKFTRSFINRICLGHGKMTDSGTPKNHRSGATIGECLAEYIAG